VVLAAVSRHGVSLRFACETLRSKRRIVLAAVKHSGLALRFAGKELRGDSELVLAAVKQNGAALQFVAKELTEKTLFVVQGIKENKDALYRVSDVITSSRDFFSDDLSLHEIPNKETDIVLGQNGDKTWPKQREFQKLLNEHFDDYEEATDKVKGALRKFILHQLWDTGARFVKVSKEENNWYEVRHEKYLERDIIGGCFRDKRKKRSRGL